MLVLERKDGQWIEIRDRDGNLLRVRVYHVRGTTPDSPGRVNLAFDDAPHNFDIQRPERSRGWGFGAAMPAPEESSDAGRPAPPPPRFAVCIGPAKYADIRPGATYRVLADGDDYLRIVDDSGEDYLYPAALFRMAETSR